MYFLRCCCFLFRFLFCFCCRYILAVFLFNDYLLWYDHVASLEPYLSWWKDTYCISSKKHLEVFLVIFLSCISSKALCSLVIEIVVLCCVKMFDLCFNFLLLLNKKNKQDTIHSLEQSLLEAYLILSSALFSDSTFALREIMYSSCRLLWLLS